MDSDQFEAAFLIKAKRIQIIIGCNKENTPATFFARLFNHFLDEHRTNAHSFAQHYQGKRSHTHSPEKVIGDLADPFIVVKSDKSIQSIWIIDHAMGYHKFVTPVFLPKLAQARQVIDGKSGGQISLHFLFRLNLF